MRNANWGCLLLIAACVAIDVAAFLALRAFAAWLVMVAGFAAAG